MAKERAQAKKQVGVVTSAKMQKTITVVVDRRVKHPKYGKFVRRRTKLTAHDEHGVASEGDTVEVVFTRPLSKTKRWRLVRVVRKVVDFTVPAPATAGEEAPVLPDPARTEG